MPAKRPQSRKPRVIARKPQASVKEWKKRKQVKQLTISNTRLGGNRFGDVYVGRLKFKDGSIHRVAVKRFQKPLTFRDVRNYEEVIQRLVRAGIKIPKIGFMKHNKEWVQVSSLFGGTKSGSKMPHLPWSSLKRHTQASPILRRQFIELNKQLIRERFPPSPDIYEILNTKKGPELCVIDLDQLAKQVNQSGNPHRQIERLRGSTESLLETCTIYKILSAEEINEIQQTLDQVLMEEG